MVVEKAVVTIITSLTTITLTYSTTYLQNTAAFLRVVEEVVVAIPHVPQNNHP